MEMLPLAKISFFWTVVAALWVLIALGLILIVLLQKGRGGGIGAAFGGGGSNSLLGTKTGDFLTWVTICLVALFLVLGVLMAKFMRPRGAANLVGPAPAQQQQPLTMPDIDGQMPVAPDTDDAAALMVDEVEEAGETLEDAADDIRPEQD